MEEDLYELFFRVSRMRRAEICESSGWFDDPEILDKIRKNAKLAHRINNLRTIELKAKEKQTKVVMEKQKWSMNSLINICDKGKWRVANTRLLLIYYGNSIPREKFQGEIRSRRSTFNFDDIIVETVFLSGNTYITVNFGSLFRTSNSKYFDVENVHPEIRIIPSQSSYDECLRYLRSKTVIKVPFQDHFYDVLKCWKREQIFSVNGTTYISSTENNFSIVNTDIEKSIDEIIDSATKLNVSLNIIAKLYPEKLQHYCTKQFSFAENKSKWKTLQLCCNPPAEIIEFLEGI